MCRTSVCFLVLVILLVIICAAALAARDRKHLPYLSSEARDEFFRFMAVRPDARCYEEARSGVPDITRDPEKFFAVELMEPEHGDVIRAVMADNGMITGSSMRRWIAESTAEVDGATQL